MRRHGSIFSSGFFFYSAYEAQAIVCFVNRCLRDADHFCLTPQYKSAVFLRPLLHTVCVNHFFVVAPAIEVLEVKFRHSSVKALLWLDTAARHITKTTSLSHNAGNVNMQPVIENFFSQYLPEL